MRLDKKRVYYFILSIVEGVFYQQGSGVQKDLKKAAYWYEQLLKTYKKITKNNPQLEKTIIVITTQYQILSNYIAQAKGCKTYGKHVIGKNSLKKIQCLGNVVQII